MDITVLWDWDGTLVNTMPNHAELAADCIRRHFGVTPEYGKQKYLATTGLPFDSQLQKIFPDASKETIMGCAEEYHFRKIEEVYGNPTDFPNAIATVAAIQREFPGTIQVISSSTEENIITEWLNPKRIRLFSDIFGRESGTKKDHIEKLTIGYTDVVRIFISDSVGDMGLPARCLGVNAFGNTRKFEKSKAFAFTVNPVNPEWVTFQIRKIVDMEQT